MQAANTQEKELARFRRESEGKLEAELAGTRISGLFAPVVDLIELAGAVLVIVLGTLALAGGDLTLGGLLAFLAYLAQLYRPVRDVSRLSQTIFEASAGAERVIELLDTRPRVADRRDAKVLIRSRGMLQFERVRYTYPGAAMPALDDLSFAVRPGCCVALVGESGAGKSTVAKLALRFADPDRGIVRLDGYDLRDLQLRWLRENVGILLQDAPLFDGTVRDNVAYGREATDAQVRGVLDAVGLGLDPATRTGQRGRALSGGERRRVAMARVLLQDAPVLVLDEPSAGLDTDATRDLLDPLRAAHRRPRRPAHHPRPDPDRGRRRGRRAARHGRPGLSRDRAPQPHAPLRHLRGVERGPRVLVRGEGRPRGPPRGRSGCARR